MSAVELTPEQSALYSMQYQPQHITQVEILGEKPLGGLTVAFATLPGIGESIYLYRLDGDTDVLEIVDVQHWAVQVMPGQAEFHDTKHFVDATITCRRSSISEQKRKESQQS